MPALSASWVLMRVKLDEKGQLNAQVLCKCWGSLLRKGFLT